MMSILEAEPASKRRRVVEEESENECEYEFESVVDDSDPGSSEPGSPAPPSPQFLGRPGDGWNNDPEVTVPLSPLALVPFYADSPEQVIFDVAAERAQEHYRALDPHWDRSRSPSHDSLLAMLHSDDDSDEMQPNWPAGFQPPQPIDLDENSDADPLSAEPDFRVPVAAPIATVAGLILTV